MNNDINSIKQKTSIEYNKLSSKEKMKIQIKEMEQKLIGRTNIVLKKTDLL